MDLKKYALSDVHEDIVEKAYDMGGGETLLSFDYDRTREFCCPLSGLGWRSVKRFSVGNTDGTFYLHESGRTMYVYTNAGVPFGRSVMGAKLPTDDNDVGEPVYKDIVFHQVWNDPKTRGGMTYLVRMKDGRFIIIDGAFNTDGEGLLRLMAQLHPKADPDKPFTVAAWIITHSHNDHIELLKNVTADESVMSRLEIKRMIANLPATDTLRGRDDDVIPDNDWATDCLGRLALRGIDVIKPYAGMKIALGELTMNVFYTQADWHFIDMKTINDASVMFSLTREGGRTVMIPGDVMDNAARYILKMYTESQLRADIVQIAHHALYGPRIDFFEAMKPKICFWPINLNGYEYTQYPFITERNDQLREMDAVHCIACLGPAQCVL